MSIINYTLDISPKDEKDLELKANGKISELKKTSRIIKEEVFNIIAENSIFFQYPIEDDEFCGFVCPKDGKLFSFVNSFISFENQIFAAAHELYHIWFDKDIITDGDFINNDIIDSDKTVELDPKEVMANRFAAMFLVPKNVLDDEINQMGLKNNEVDLYKIVKLMDIFGVSYKTMVRRLYEIQFIDREECLKMLALPSKEELSPIRIAQKRLQIGEEQQRRTKTIRFDGLSDKALSAYERKLISEQKLIYLLSIVRKTPEEFGITTKVDIEKDIQKYLENDM